MLHADGPGEAARRITWVADRPARSPLADAVAIAIVGAAAADAAGAGLTEGDFGPVERDTADVTDLDRLDLVDDPRAFLRRTTADLDAWKARERRFWATIGAQAHHEWTAALAREQRDSENDASQHGASVARLLQQPGQLVAADAEGVGGGGLVAVVAVEDRLGVAALGFFELEVGGDWGEIGTVLSSERNSPQVLVVTGHD